MGSYDPVHLPLPAKDHDRLADIADSITANDLKTAREEIIEELCEGKKVDGLYSYAIFDLAAQGAGHAGYDGVLSLVDRILDLDRVHGDDLIWKARNMVEEAKAFIERYVDAHPDMIQERAERNEQDRLEDCE